MIHKTKLKNGLTFIYLHTPQDPIAAGHFFLPTGAAQESNNLSGISTLMWALFLKGTRTRTAQELAEQIETMGAFIGAGTTYDHSEISCHATSDQILNVLDILSDALHSPAFKESEIQKEKLALEAAIKAKQENIFTVTQDLLNEHLFPKHPYGRPTSGTDQTISSITAKDLFAWHEQVAQPASSVFSMASDIPFENILPSIEAQFGGRAWPSDPRHQPRTVESISHPGHLDEVRHSSHFEQAYLMIGFPAAPVHSEDYIPLKVLNAILGGGMSARLFHHLREVQGLAYEVGSFYASRQHGSGLVIHMGLQHERLGEAKYGIFKQLTDLQESPVPENELNQIKNQLRGTFILDQQTNSQRSHYRGWWEILGLGMDYEKTFFEKISKLTPLDIQETAQKYFNRPYVSVETISEKKHVATKN